VSVAVSSDVCLRIITELLNEYAYQASVAGRRKISDFTTCIDM
jgi:hypothetical protein